MASSISLPMVGCLAFACKMRPARLARHPEHVLGSIFVRVLGGERVLRQQRGAPRLEGVGNVLEEDQTERDMLVVGRLEVLAQLVGGEEQLRLEAEVGPVVLLLRRRRNRAFCFSWSTPRHSPPSDATNMSPRVVDGPYADVVERAIGNKAATGLATGSRSSPRDKNLDWNKTRTYNEAVTGNGDANGRANPGAYAQSRRSASCARGGEPTAERNEPRPLEGN